MPHYECHGKQNKSRTRRGPPGSGVLFPVRRHRAALDGCPNALISDLGESRSLAESH